MNTEAELLIGDPYPTEFRQIIFYFHRKENAKTCVFRHRTFNCTFCI